MQIGGERQFSAQAWLHDEVLAVCSLKGEVVIIQDAAQQVLMQLHTPLYCIAPVGKGFAVGTDSAIIRFRAVDSRIRHAMPAPRLQRHPCQKSAWPFQHGGRVAHLYHAHMRSPS